MEFQPEITKKKKKIYIEFNELLLYWILLMST